MITLLLNGAWVWLAIRLLGWRSTVSNRTLLKFFVLGAVISFSVAGPLQKAVNPVANNSGWLSYSLNIVMQLLLLAPLWVVLRGKTPYRALSVSDAFLLAFALGFGFDVMGALPGITIQGAHTFGIQFLPSRLAH